MPTIRSKGHSLGGDGRSDAIDVNDPGDVNRALLLLLLTRTHAPERGLATSSPDRVPDLLAGNGVGPRAVST